MILALTVVFNSVFTVLNVVLIRNLECKTSLDERQKGNLPKDFNDLSLKCAIQLYQ